jgi:hypothetical protein
MSSTAGWRSSRRCSPCCERSRSGHWRCCAGSRSDARNCFADSTSLPCVRLSCVRSMHCVRSCYRRWMSSRECSGYPMRLRCGCFRYGCLRCCGCCHCCGSRHCFCWIRLRSGSLSGRAKPAGYWCRRSIRLTNPGCSNGSKSLVHSLRTSSTSCCSTPTFRRTLREQVWPGSTQQIEPLPPRLDKCSMPFAGLCSTYG